MKDLLTKKNGKNIQSEDESEWLGKITMGAVL